MPRAVDRRQLTVTHDPTYRIPHETPKTPRYKGPTQAFPPSTTQPKHVVPADIEELT